MNGTRGNLTAVDPARRAVELRTDSGAQVTLPAAYLDAGLLDHGYALTAHKAQGATVERAWVLGSDAVYREWGYVALSRGRAENRLYITAPEPSSGALEAHTPPEPARDPLQAVTAALERSRAQHLAVDHHPCDELLDRRRRRLTDQRDDALIQIDKLGGQLDQACAAIDKHRGLARLSRRRETDRLHTTIERLEGDLDSWRQHVERLDDRLAALPEQPVVLRHDHSVPGRSLELSELPTWQVPARVRPGVELDHCDGLAL